MSFASSSPSTDRPAVRLAVASGKGGTGKTTVAVNLALAAAAATQLLDCDVEEPNCHLFVAPVWAHREDVGIPVPRIDPGRCDNCGACVAACRYGALARGAREPLVFAELCHGCGGCTRVCPRQAIREEPHPIGELARGSITRPDGRTLAFVHGELRVSHPMSPPLIRAVKRQAARRGLIVLDCPPGTACPMVAAVHGCDAVLLVTEPTPFGLHDLTLAVATVRELGVPAAVVINRADSGDDRVQRYCATAGVPVLAEFAEDRRLAVAYARGVPAVQALPEYAPRFAALAEAALAMAAGAAVAGGAAHA